jgi:hypothetical protein
MLSWPSRPGTPTLPARVSSSPSLWSTAASSSSSSLVSQSLPDFEDSLSPFSPNFRNTFAARLQPHARGPFNTPERVAAWRAARLDLPVAGTPSGFGYRQQALRRPAGGYPLPSHGVSLSNSPAPRRDALSRAPTPSPNLVSATRIAAPSELRALSPLVSTGSLESLHRHGVQRPSWWGDGL